MKTNELKFFRPDNIDGPKPWTLRGGFHMRSASSTVSSGYEIEACDGTLVAHTTGSGDVWWGGHKEASRIMAEGLE